MGVPGHLPKIAWEKSKLLEKGKPASAAPAPSSRTVAMKPKDVDLDVFQRSAKTRKPVLLYFSGERCDVCRTMENLVLRQKTVVDQAKKYHAVQIVADFVKPEILKKYKVNLAPTILLLDYEGNPIVRCRGRQSPRRLAAVLEEVARENTLKAERDREKEEKAAKASGKAPGR